MPPVFFVLVGYIIATEAEYFQGVAVNDAIALLTQPVLAVPDALFWLAALAHLTTRLVAVEMGLVTAFTNPPVHVGFYDKLSCDRRVR